MRVSEVSLGAWLTFGGSVDDEVSKACLETAIDSGINFIDIADVYSGGNAELVVGNILAEGNYERKDLIISSKVFWPTGEGPNDMGLSNKHIMDSIIGSLNRLQVDYLDIYFCHRFDHVTPLRETIEAMDDLVRDGIVRYWGTSVWSATQLERAIGICKEIGARLPSVEQPRYNMLDRQIERDVMDTAKYHGLGIVPWSPLGAGLLTGKYNNGIPEGSRGESNQFLKDALTEDNLSKVRKLNEIAKQKEISLAEMALAWVLRRDEITSVITGATKVEQITNNVNASGIKFSNDELENIEKVLMNKPKPHPLYEPQWLGRN